ncbi:MAPEG family protein [Microvirga terricola]|uniref:MAPEG family protein n=1 Tax=Microvirga terricola TaxID=2719797 RepID=A0ABX0VDW9_9HYPH|nr:MAPEG family protein [Microvirga terricola]NIX77681.1 MAPEG family protein [Microvirga terricola]
MSVPAILAPVFAQVALTFVLMFWMGRSRVAHIRAGDVKIKEIALGERNWPTQAQQVTNAYGNQFETPVLFYVLVILALVTRKADLAFVVMSWVYVVSRMAHAYIHTTSNRVTKRFQVFLVGALILVLMWVLFAVRVFFAEVGV